ncbi:Gfo/Idh/MocA family oxidoreductase [Qipengyuania sp. 6B39]|uniref:Gfo/Idh/MocA family oxidoreductase n=1 Tax=Qipengyuania proteolytica TaxID=2867239 RepID=UPI001C8A91D4|nr:Gfo/Idh/MocA family oxidoreductase [Qipengyuania proteolytica]MBX7495769.1 Gfo/Idh/MocA family oxidoreductase [Qipengyuania proteolytica]
MAGRLRLGMIGGGQGAFIGAVHRAAARLDGATALVCGCFSRDPANSRETAQALHLDPERAYPSAAEMFAAEAARGNDAMEAVVIVTPNDTHVPLAKAAAEAGFHVMSDKPAGIALSEVKSLAETLSVSGTAYGLTHTYLGYPMVWQARHLATSKAFGAIRRILVEYPQGWLSSRAEADGSKQAEWRTDPARSGPSGAFGDIGSHAHSLAEFVANSRMTRLSARLRSHFVERRLDDDGEASFEMENGATGVLVASQVCAGEENSLAIRIYGENAGLEWRQMEPNTLIERRGDGSVFVHRAGVDKPLCDEALARCRLPSGHPEGYIEAFANLYRDFAGAVRDGAPLASRGVPGIAEALRGMAFLEASVASAQADGAWTDIAAPSTGPDLKGLLT